MNTIQSIYLIFCGICLIQIIIYVVHAKTEISYNENRGILKPNYLTYNIFSSFMNNFITFNCMSFAILTSNYVSFILFFYININILLISIVSCIYSRNGYLYLSYIWISIFELFFIGYNRKIFLREILFNRNKRIGSNLFLKHLLKVSKN
ncbi:hypothetical protein H311_03908 [Anncaliia algerae PRA109]|nr:hypothetical protein H311_03908 [Anncaliia algerae PRA109]